MSRERVELFVVRHEEVVTQGPAHCNNDCPQLMNIEKLEDGTYQARCNLFNIKLKWDKRCRHNGYLRTDKCVQQARVHES
jgi:hypothetical protein